MSRNNKRILGIDHGKSHSGIAISLDGLPLGLETVESFEDQMLVDRIQELIEENQIEVIVIGLPLSNIHDNKQVEIIYKFIKKLKKEIDNVKIETVNEQMSTKMVGRYSSKEGEHQEVARLLIEDWIAQE